MRFVAMKLHTRDQAPKEGQQPASPQPMQKVTPGLVLIRSHCLLPELIGLQAWSSISHDRYWSIPIYNAPLDSRGLGSDMTHFAWQLLQCSVN